MKFAAAIGPLKTAEIAERTDTHPDTVRAWKRGEIIPTDAARIVALAALLKIDAATLLDMLADDTRTRAARVITEPAA